MSVQSTALRRVRALPTTLLVGLVIVAAVLVVCAAAPLLAPYPPTELHLLDALQGPSLAHPFGTDALGRDLLSRVVYGARYELSVIVPVIALVTVIGVPLGMVAGYRRGWTDRSISFVSDSVLTFPAMVLAVVLVAIFGSGYLSLVVTITITQVPQMVRYARGFTGGVAAAEFLLAAKASGTRAVGTLARHVLPNIAGSVVVVASLFASEALLVITALGFLGIGVQPPTPEWGTMLSEGRQDFTTSPQVMLFPGLAIAVLILGFNLLGDGLRDAVDKRNN